MMTNPTIGSNSSEPVVQSILEKYDSESRFHKFLPKSPAAIAVTTIAVLLSLFHLYTAYYGELPALQHRSIHLGAMLVLAYILYPFKKGGRLSAIDLILATASAATAVYMLWDHHALVQRIGRETPLDLFFAAMTVILVLEAARRVLGKELSILAVVFLLYAYFGPYMPGILGHRGYGIDEILGFMYLTTEGLYGSAIRVSASYIILFIIFGAFLEKTGVGRFFNDLALGLAGGSAGGPAKVAVVSSALLGTISGSAVANVVTTGAFTIPLMKRLGYRADFAGAVEAAASVGGQILPPVMGAAAFIMAETLGMPYAQIAMSAAIPAVLYFLSVGIMVHLRAKKLGLAGLPKHELPVVRRVLFQGGHMFLPLFALMYMLLSGFTVTRSAFIAIILVILTSFFRKDTRMTPTGFIEALESGARNTIGVAIACGVVGLIIGVAAQTGFAMRLAGTILLLGQGNLTLTLILTMFASLILGMGIPSIPTYIITSTMAAPALAELGVPIFVSHMFVFYFGILANLTPPVALAAFAGAGIAGANPHKTFAGAGIAAMQLATASALLGVIALGAAVEGWVITAASWPQRALLLASALLLIKPGGVTDVLGIALMAVVWAWQTFHVKRQRSFHT
ncbi:MAG: Sialic acid TRAP transporter permease protein SiaT [Firmicutes bacterium]|nr:Sialic acid TRAP transporter permease protein SiaT [Bacillota bacterium]